MEVIALLPLLHLQLDTKSFLPCPCLQLWCCAVKSHHHVAAWEASQWAAVWTYLQPPNCLWISASCCLLVSLYFASTLALCPSPLWCSERVLCFCVLAPDGLESSLMAPSYPKPGEFCGWFSSVLWTHSSPASIPSAVCQKWTDSAALPNPVWHLKMEGTARFFVPVPSWHWQGTFSALEKDKCADLFCPLDLNRGCYVTLSLWGLPEHTPYITPQQVAIE